MDELVISIDSTGSARAMYSDDFNLAHLGEQEVARQTDILFDTGTQTWYIVYLHEGLRYHSTIPGFLALFSWYETARSFEVSWLNECRLQGVSPISQEGEHTGQRMRTALCGT